MPVHIGDEQRNASRIGVIRSVVHAFVIAEKNEMRFGKTDLFTLKGAVAGRRPIFFRSLLRFEAAVNAVMVGDETGVVPLLGMPLPVGRGRERGTPVVRVARV